MLRDEVVNAVVEAIRLAETALPKWVYEKLLDAYERSEGLGKAQLAAILNNIELAVKEKKPMCQDTGLMTFDVIVGDEFPIKPYEIEELLKEAVRRATREVPIRPNSVDPLSGHNPGDNVGKGVPVTNIKVVPGNTLLIKVRPKGGGSEYPSNLCMIPPSKGLEGVRECVLKAVFEAGGKPCPPGIVGVAFGGTVEETAKLAKEALYRPEAHEEERVARIEKELLDEVNSLGLGPMGLGGGPTALAVRADYAYRHPASFPVAVRFNCWAAREAVVEVNADGSWKLVSDNVTPEDLKTPPLEAEDGVEIKLPVEEEEVRKLKAGDVVYLTGTVVTARDEAHKKIIEEGAPLDLKGLAIYHCGPVVTKEEGRWKVVAAGPTTSARMNALQAQVLEKTGARLVIGKGGMKEDLLDFFKRFGAAYLAFPGGAALLAAKAIKAVRGVYWLEELGIPEAMWVFEVEKFGPLVVAMDSHGRSLYKEVSERAKTKLEELLK
ncbi:fumarate hydratase [Ignicoccus hospitalis]|uniref:Fumarase n=1 Tax=Ignicoccus hospitalis (strain KIN4/I / DSM 18386 / JCM 14125) TaxID=453591 RepID=A8AAA8_IGNH4|nr:fumarate hydratase [Ignicoccus hospitalis]ABU81860.1 fumarase [Ignicoccus hospitalis KIN4/I]HIH90128.1 fumarate hydratase [Desulfurococcaceae archaeon]